jgi:GT2 family glycosyltransferase
MELPSASGASLLIPRKALEQVGLLDERYFLYFEDTDYCLQCKARRFSIRLAAKSIVYHEEGATTGKKSLATQYYYQRNRLLLMQRFCQPVQWSTVLAYSRIRLLRLMLTARNPEKKASLRVFRLAFNDALNGVTGRCPHSLTHSD